MSNLTITVGEATLKKARLRALTGGVSINEVLKTFLESYADVGAEQAVALDDPIDPSRRANRGTWTPNAGRARSFNETAASARGFLAPTSSLGLFDASAPRKKNASLLVETDHKRRSRSS